MSPLRSPCIQGGDFFTELARWPDGRQAIIYVFDGVGKCHILVDVQTERD
ncbi:MAG: hypothetical protein VX668_05875 [Planctomycetota bacterium]|nr:hypothetical protein [Planctomycetota bacterium]